MKKVLLFFCLLLPFRVFSQEAEAGKSVEDQRRDTIRYGTESEIALLIQSLKSEQAFYLDDELVSLVERTLNRSILTGVFTFFADRGKEGLESRALRAITEWDAEAGETIIAAINYLGRVKDADAVRPLKALISAQDTRFTNQVFRALGRIAGGNGGIRDEIARYLMEYYTERIPPDESRRELVAALGETASPEAVSFLSGLAENNDERLTIRMAAVESLSAIGDEAGLPAIIAGATSPDPNLRAASIGALGPYQGEEVDHAILEAFRDSFYRTRIGAAQAAGRRKMAAAVPYLEYRALHDEVAAVKDEAIKALAVIGGPPALSILDDLFGSRSSTDRVRILAAEMLVREDAGAYTRKVIAELDDAKQRNQTALYNGLLRVIGGARAGDLEALAERFLLSGGVTEKSWALEIIKNNRFTGLMPQVEILSDPKNGSIARRAQAVLEDLRRD